MKHPARLTGLAAFCLLSSSVLADITRYIPVWAVTGDQVGATGIFAAMDITLDPSGNLLVVGNGGNGSSPIGIVAKISPAGSVLWYKSVTQPLMLGSSANAVACDASGNVYVGGGFVMASGADIIVQKLDSTGSVVWTLTTSGGFGGIGTGVGATAIAVDSTGVYVGGAWGNPVAEDWLAKIALSGGWAGSVVQSVIAAAGWSVTSVSLDSSSNVYASFNNATLPPSFQVPALAAFTSAGTLIWSRTNTTWNATDCGGVALAGPFRNVSRVRVASDGTVWAMTIKTDIFQLAAATGAITKGSTVESPGNSTHFDDFAFWPAGFAVFAGPGGVAGKTSWGAVGGTSCLGGSNGWFTSDFSRVLSSSNQSFTPTAVAAGSNGDIYVAGAPGAAVIALRDILGQNPVKAGTLEIRNNIINLGDNKPGGQQYEHTAYLLVRGDPYRGVRIGVFGPSGRFMGALPDIGLGADGTGILAFDGVVQGKRLSSGMYYIVANGNGFNDRKPIMILGRKDQ